MKKFLKIIFLVIIIFIILLIINFGRNYFILKKIYSLGNKFDAGNNYHIKVVTKTSMVNTTNDYYYMNNKYLSIDKIEYIHTENLSAEEQESYTKEYNCIIFNNLLTNEYLEFTANENEEFVLSDNPVKKDESNVIEGYIYCNSYEFSSLLKKYIFKFIKEDNENYIINLDNKSDEYIDKSNGLLKAIKSVENNIDTEITFEKDVVDDTIMDINNYIMKNN